MKDIISKLDLARSFNEKLIQIALKTSKKQRLMHLFK